MKLQTCSVTLTNKFFYKIRNHFEEKFVCKTCQLSLYFFETITELTRLEKHCKCFSYYLVHSGSIIQIAKKYASLYGGWF